MVHLVRPLGYVFHEKTRHDVRRLSIPEVGLRIGSLAVVLAAAYWLAVVMPANVRGLLAAAGVVGFSVGAVPILVQPSVTKYPEPRQLLP